MGTIASQITSLTIVYSTVYSDADQGKTSLLRVTCLCAGNSPGSGEFPTQMANNAENVSIWWRHHGKLLEVVVMITSSVATDDKFVIWQFTGFSKKNIYAVLNTVDKEASFPYLLFS